MFWHVGIDSPIYYLIFRVTLRLYFVAVTNMLEVNFYQCKSNWKNLWVSGLSIVIACILAIKLILKLPEVVVIPPRDVRLEIFRTKLSILVRRDFVTLVQFVNLVCFSDDQDPITCEQRLLRQLNFCSWFCWRKLCS